MKNNLLSFKIVLPLRLVVVLALGTAFLGYAMNSVPFGIESSPDIFLAGGLFAALYVGVTTLFAIDKKADNLSLIFLAAVIAALVFLRYSMLGYTSGDYNSFLFPWVSEMKGLSVREALVTKIGDYNMPYLYFLLFVSRRTTSPLVWIKWLSCLFDFLTAYFVMKTVALKTENKTAQHFSFILAAALPTVFLNSGYWGQCDSIVAAFCVISIYFALKGNGIPSIIFYALAFSVKLQAIFILPALIVCFFTKKLRLWHAALFPATFLVTLLPAMIAGRSFMDCVGIYFDQTEQYPSLTLNAPSVWQLLGNFNFDYFSSVGVMLGGIGAVTLIYIAYIYRDKLDVPLLIDLFFISSLLIPFLLPRMHERYFYTADILSVLVFFYDKKRWYIPLVTVFSSLNAYLAYLSGNTVVPQGWTAFALLVILIISIKSLIERIKTV